MTDGESLMFPYNLDTNLSFMLLTNGQPELEQTTDKAFSCCRKFQHTVGLNRDDVDLFASPNELFEFMSVADKTNQNLTQPQK